MRDFIKHFEREPEGAWKCVTPAGPSYPVYPWYPVIARPCVPCIRPRPPLTHKPASFARARERYLLPLRQVGMCAGFSYIPAGSRNQAVESGRSGLRARSPDRSPRQQLTLRVARVEQVMRKPHDHRQHLLSQGVDV